MNKDRILLLLFYFAGVCAFAVFIITKSEGLMDWATDGMYDDGDLYRFAKVLPFKQPIPPLAPPSEDEDADPDTAALIIIGDSFMETCRGHRPFPLDLETQTGKSVYPEYALERPESFDPIFFCWKNNIDPDRRHVILLERIERYIIFSFDRQLGGDLSAVDSVKERRASLLQTLKRRWFTEAEKNYQVFLTGSDFTRPLVELWNTFRFYTLGEISEQTPRYSLRPPFLFEKEETDSSMSSSFYYPHPDSLIDELASNLASARDTLLARYNTELVFMPVPNAYTLYHGLITDDRYDDFLPRLCAALEAKGVRTIDLYHPFRNAGKFLYFPTDTHWNRDGEQLAVKEALKVLAPLMQPPRENDQ